MKTLTNIAVFESDKYILAMLNGYCYANKIAIIEVESSREGIRKGINEIKKINPALIVVPLDWESTVYHRFDKFLKQAGIRAQVKICGLNKNSTRIDEAGFLTCIDVFINHPFEIAEIDKYIQKTFLLNNRLTQDRRCLERRSFKDRRYIEFYNHGEDGNRAATKPEFKNFQIDQRSMSLFLKGQKINLSHKEFELIKLLLTDVDRIFKAEEIINHLWPENKRATKSDLYQYMHLLRKKIENDPNNPQWIQNVKGFGYKLSIDNS